MRFFRHSSEGWNPSRLRAWLRRRMDPSLRWGDEKKRRDESGFTLVELMVVIVIIGLLATIVIINVMPAADRAAATKARADVATLDQGVQMYRLNNGRYPTGEEGLQALVPEFIQRLPNDPWSNPYRYSVPGQDGRPYTIATWGADGREGGSGENEDIAN